MSTAERARLRAWFASIGEKLNTAPSPVVGAAVVLLADAGVPDVMHAFGQKLNPEARLEASNAISEWLDSIGLKTPERTT